MKLFLLTGMLLVALPGAAQSKEPAKAVVLTPSEDEKVILAFFNEVGGFIRQVLAEPNDTAAINLLLHGPEPDRLKRRGQQLQPTMARWRRTFTDDQLQSAFEDLMQRSELKALTALDTDAAVEARLKRSPDLKSALEWTIYNMLM
jgi:hypothetical protein